MKKTRKNKIKVDLKENTINGDLDEYLLDIKMNLSEFPIKIVEKNSKKTKNSKKKH